MILGVRDNGILKSREIAEKFGAGKEGIHLKYFQILAFCQQRILLCVRHFVCRTGSLNNKKPTQIRAAGIGSCCEIICVSKSITFKMKMLEAKVE